MKSIYILSFVLLVIGLAFCKQESGNVQQEPTQDTTKVTALQEPAGQVDAPSKAISGGHDYTFLTDKLFHFKAAFGGESKGEQLFKDEWIDLDPAGTFKAGKLKEQTHTGKWDYNNDLKVLQLRPDVKTFKMSEWKVMFNEKMMVWIGTQTFSNHSTQVQLVRSDVLP